MLLALGQMGLLGYHSGSGSTQSSAYRPAAGALARCRYLSLGGRWRMRRRIWVAVGLLVHMKGCVLVDIRGCWFLSLCSDAVAWTS